MDTLDYIVKKYSIDPNKKEPIQLAISRWNSFPILLKELGFTKGVEIGVYKGNFSETLCSHIPNLDLCGVDAWTVYGDYKDYEKNNLEVEAYEEAKKRAEKYGFKLIKAWSLDAVKQFEDESLDFVFIDGNHDFRHVTDDVDEWSKKVRRGGIVAGHDFNRNHKKRFGVKEAIPAYCCAEGIKPLFVIAKDQCKSWFYVKQ